MSPTRQNAIATAQLRRPRDRMQSPLHSKVAHATGCNRHCKAKSPTRHDCKSPMQYLRLSSRRTAR
eukprot:3004163-Amphidinium_carterae.1